MPKILKLSALRNYSEVLDEVKPGHPVYLTKNGEGRYVILDLEEYDSLKQGLWQRQFAELDDSVLAVERYGWVDEEKAEALLDGLAGDDEA